MNSWFAHVHLQLKQKSQFLAQFLVPGIISLLVGLCVCISFYFS